MSGEAILSWVLLRWLFLLTFPSLDEQFETPALPRMAVFRQERPFLPLPAVRELPGLINPAQILFHRSITMNPRPDPSPLLSRRHFLSNTAGGLGGVALAWLLAWEQSRAASPSAQTPHFAPKAKRVVQIFCCGGVSHQIGRASCRERV